jgi:hypothetical protein
MTKGGHGSPFAPKYRLQILSKRIIFNVILFASLPGARFAAMERRRRA